jgi:uncharacterized membrane protein
MINITVRTEIDVPAATAFAYVADFSNNAAWQSGVRSTQWTSTSPVRMGSTYNQQVEYRNITTSYEITAIEADRSITTESRDGATVATTVTRTVDPLGESRCRITVDLVGRPSGFRRFVKPILVRMVRDSIESDYRRLKRQLESDEADG